MSFPTDLDTAAETPVVRPFAALEIDIAPLLELARALLGEGRQDNVLLLCEHVLRIVPEHTGALRLAADAKQADGDIDAAMNYLLRAKSAAPDIEVSPSIVAQAIELFNQYIGAGQFRNAQRLSTLLAELFPGAIEIVKKAAILSKAIGDLELAERYARWVVAVDPDHEPSLAILDEVAAMGAGGEDATTGAPALDGIVGALPRLSEIHDDLSQVLCDSAPADADEVARLVSDARSIVRAAGDDLADEEPTDRSARLARYLLTLTATVDFDLVMEPPPVLPARRGITFGDTSGQARTATELRMAATRMKAPVIVFAAADERSFLKSGKAFATSVLKEADVPCLVLLHIVGGLGRVAELTRALRMTDSRLFFSADDFSPARATGRSVNPPEGNRADPGPLAAYLRSAPLLWLGHLLDRFHMPILVADIERPLPGRLSGFLASLAGSDLMLRETAGAPSFDSRLRSDLLLAAATEGAMHYCAFVRRYLESALTAPQIGGRVDQVALLLARHHVARTGDTTIAYFAGENVS